MSKVLAILCVPLFLMGCNLGDPVQPAKIGNELAYAADQSFWIPFSWGDKEIATVQGSGVAVIDYYGPNYIYKYLGSYGSGSWHWIGSGASKITMEPNGDPVAIMPDGGAWRFLVATNAWQNMNLGYTVRDLSIGGGNGNIWLLSTVQYSTGSYWVGRRNTDGSVSWVGGGKKIAVRGYNGGSFSSAEIIDANGLIWDWNGAAWVQVIPGGAAAGLLATDIAFGTDNVNYVVGNDFDAQGNARVWQVSTTGMWDNFFGVRGVRVAVGNASDVFITQADGTTLHRYM